jgi:hypothetical protein
MKQNQFITLLSVIAILFTSGLFSADLPEGFQLFFNNASHSQSNGIDLALAELIDSADESVAAAFYSIGRVVIADALIDAAHRLGFENVRVITDANYRHQSACKRIEDAGLYLIDETCDGWSGDSLHMHHKFLVVDGESVWTGSYNITDSGTIYNNNHAVLIDCVPLAEAYLTEFNEMWGAESGAPGDCAFSRNKNTVIEHFYICNDVPVDVYFSPTNNSFPLTAYDALMNQMDNTIESIRFSMFTFTQMSLAGKLVQRHNSGICVRGVMDEFQGTGPYSVYDYLVDNNIDVILNTDVTPHGNLLHHKFAVFDHNLPTATVVTGSYNWTLAAQNTNDENTLFIHDQAIAYEFFKEFHRNYYGFDPGANDPIIDIQVNQSVFYPGSAFVCTATLTNPAHSSVSFYEYIILDIGEGFGADRYFFWPSWSADVDSQYIVLGANSRLNQSILQFVTPLDMPPIGPLTIWAGMVDSTGNLLGDIDHAIFEFR